MKKEYKFFVLSVFFLLVLSLNVYADQLTPNSHFTFNQTSSPMINDGSDGNTYNLVGTGNFGTVGLLNNSYSVTNQEKINSSANPYAKLNATTNFSLMGWVKKTVNPSGGTCVVRIGTLGENRYCLYFNTDSTYAGNVIDFGVASLNTPSSAVANSGQWYWLYLQQNGSTLYFYFNNTLVGSLQHNLSTILDNGVLDVGSIEIIYAGTLNFDDLRFYNHTLNASERSFIYNSGLGTENITYPSIPIIPYVININTPADNSAFYFGNHNYFDVNITSSNFVNNEIINAFIFNNTGELLYYRTNNSNTSFRFNATNLGIGTYTIYATTKYNFTNYNLSYDSSNNVFVNKTGVFDGVRQGGQNKSDFNTNDYVRSANFGVNTSGITLLVWFRGDNFTANMGLVDMATFQARGFEMFMSAPSTVYSRVNFGGSTIQSNVGTDLLNNTIYMATMIYEYNGTNKTLNNYINGAFTFSVVGNSSLMVQPTENFDIGVRDNVFFNGSIYKVILWNRSLSASEVASEYVLGANSPTNITDGLVLQYLLNNTAPIYSNSTNVFNVNKENPQTTVYIYNLTTGIISNPTNNSNIINNGLNIVWTNTTINPTSLGVTINYYNISLLNNDLTFNKTLNTSTINNNYNWSFINDNLNIGLYWIRLETIDSKGNNLTTRSLFNLTVNAQVNITAKRINNNATINSFTTIITDQITGQTQTNSTTTSNIIFDVVKQRNYSVVITSENYTTSNANMSINESFNNRLFYLTRFNSIQINFYDEDTLNLIINQTTYLDLISSLYSNNYSTSNGTLFVDLLSPTTYQSRYSSINYTERFYSFTIVNDTSQTISLYLKRNTTSILIQVKDVALNSVEGAVVKAQKLVSSLGGTFLTVEICTTDFNGECIMSLTQNDEYYRFIVLIDNNVELTTTASYIIDNIVTLTLPGQGTNADDSFEYLNIESDVSWINSTKTFSFDFSDPNNLQSNYCLDIYRNDALINRTCITSDLGSIDVGLLFSNNTNGTFKANGLILINNDYLLLDQNIQYFPLAGTVANTGKLGMLIQFMISLVFIIAVKNNPEFIPIAFGLSLIFGKAGSFTLLSWTTVSAIAFACLIISVWLGKNKND